MRNNNFCGSEKAVRRKGEHKWNDKSSKLPNDKEDSLYYLESHKERGQDFLEYVVEREDKQLLAVLRLPLVVTAFIVILWSFSVLPTSCTVYTIPVVVLFTYLHVWNTVVKEALIVTSTLGIQVQQTNILGRIKYVKYVPIENIKAVVINEIIRRQRVISYLLIVLESTESTGKIMVPLLTETLPRLRTIEHIYQHVQEVIF